MSLHRYQKLELSYKLIVPTNIFFINERNILEMYALPYNNIATCGKASRALKSARNRDSTCETLDNLRCVGLLDESCIVYLR